MVHPLVVECNNSPKMEQIAGALTSSKTVFLHSALGHPVYGRYSFLATDPFLVFSSSGSSCCIETSKGKTMHFGNPWRILDELLPRYELLDQIDYGFPAGGCFGYFGYELNRFSEPCLPTRVTVYNPGPDCWLGFFSSLVVHDHQLEKRWIVSTGLNAEGERSLALAESEVEKWNNRISHSDDLETLSAPQAACLEHRLSRSEYIHIVQRAKEYIRAGDIYQVNLANRFSTPWGDTGFNLFRRLKERSPAPYSAYLNCGDLEIASSSPELFLRLNGSRVETRPIKGTRPRSRDETRDAQLAFELQTSQKELAELVMITDLLRNDLGRFCEYGSVTVPSLVTLESFPQVHHLVSTVQGLVRPEFSHFQAAASAFPGGSITGAPKIRAMQIIHELEPCERGPYTGCIGYIGFNRESQLNIAIRTTVIQEGVAAFHAGAGIVADSDPAGEYEETLAKAGGFLAAINSGSPPPASPTIASPPDAQAERRRGE